MTKSFCLRCAVWGAAVLIVFLVLTPRTSAQAKNEAADSPKSDPSLLTLDRIFNSKDFELEKTPALSWRKRGSDYVTQESSPGDQQLLAHDPATGRREVLVPGGNSGWREPFSGVIPGGGNRFHFLTRTVFHAMGIDDLHAIDREGRPFNLMEDGRPLTELF